MKFSLYIAKRYLFSKKSHQVINIISGVAVAGVALATVAMVCTLSVFNGFQELVAMQFTAFDPEIKITASHGKSIDMQDARIAHIISMPQIEIATRCIEDKAMVQYNGRQVMVTLKGVEQNFNNLTNIEEALIGNGDFILNDSIAHYAVPGAGLTAALNCGIYFVSPLEIYAPKRGRKVNINNPATNFNKGELHASGVIFAVNQPKYDDNYILTSFEFARKIFGRDENEAGSLEIRLSNGANLEKTQKEIKEILGSDYTVQNRYEQQADIFKIMKVEKIISYIFLTFILLVACFNIIGSLSMLILDKKQDIETLRSMGADNKLIANIFIGEGSIISALGAASGIVMGIILCLLQQYIGFLTLGDGNFVVNSYPVKLEGNDILIVFATVLAVGFFSVGIPVRLLTRRILKTV